MCVYTCLYVHTYMQCLVSGFAQKSPIPACSRSLCLDFGDSPHLGLAPPFPIRPTCPQPLHPPLELQAGGAPGVPGDQDQ